MTTDDLTRTITKFTVSNGRGPNSVSELQAVLASELNAAIPDADLEDELEKAMAAGFVGRDNQGCFVVL